MLNISIPKPCHEDWNAMTPTEKGAFCAACAKEVMDFSNMNDDEVKHYFLLNAGKKTCGRFHKEQLKGLNIVVDEQLIYTNIALWKKFLAVVVICFGTFFASCADRKEKKESVEEMGLMALPVQVDTTGTNRTAITGKTLISPGSIKEPPLPNSSNSKIETINTSCYVVGDIAPPPAIEPVREPVEMAPTPEIEPMPKDSVKKVIDTCNNPKFL